MKIKKEALFRLLRENAGAPRQFRELMHHFGIDKARRSQFKEFMDGLVDDGELVKLKGNLYAVPTDTGLIPGRLIAHRDGYGFVSPDAGGEDIFIPARYLTDNMHGDHVEVRIASSRRDGKREGRIVRTLERAHVKVVGRFEETKGGGFVIPDEVRITQDILILPKAKGAAQSGQVVVAEITSYPTGRRKAEGRVAEVLGWPEEPEVEVQTIIRKYDLPYLFSAETTASARSVSQSIGSADTEGRVDLRERLTVTIDGETARDFDDAVAVKREDGGRIRLWVSIADVSHYVEPGSLLDTEAYLRGTSVYFPDRCIPMLPEELSNGICSLNPKVDRLTVTAEMVFDKAGSVVQASFYPSVIRSAARLTYTIVKRILVDKDPEATATHRELFADLQVMEELALRLMEKRKKRGSIDFDLPEPEVVLDLQGGTLAIIRSERNLAHRIIEEFMLAANEAVASYLEGHNIPSLYRVHEPPDPLKLKDFGEFIHNFGYELRIREEDVDPSEFQRLLEEASGKPEERMINEVLLRCMKQARYGAENMGHFGLAAPCYTHFTSPIRRYPDLVVHRVLKGALTGELKKRGTEKLAETLPEIAAHTSRRERVAMEAEREIVDLKKMQFMRNKVGEEFDGFITGVASYGFFVELVELFVEGMVHVSALPNDFYRYLEKQHSLMGERTRVIFRIGDRVRVKVASVSLEKKQIDFVLAGLHESAATASILDQEEYPRIPIRGKRPPALKRSKEEGGPQKVKGKGGRRHGPRKRG